MRRFALVAILALFMTISAGLDTASAGKIASNKADSELSAKRDDFAEFAKAKIVSLGRNHHMSKLRMRVVKQPDGTYLARYHSIDEQTMKYKVRRSRSKTVPFVGTLTYHENVYEATGATPEACRNGNFIIKQVIPNRHLFSYKQNKWQ